MRNRKGRAPGDSQITEDKSATLKSGDSNGELKETSGSAADNRERIFSWFDVIRSGAQLTLDVLRVIREGSDLYRKLFR